MREGPNAQKKIMQPDKFADGLSADIVFQN